MSEEAIIRIDHLTKVYETKQRRGLWRAVRRRVEALKDVCLEIYPGEIFGLLGPNGAGKTTLIKCLTTLLLPTSGTAWVNGYQIGVDEDAIRASIGCMLMGERGVYWKLTGRENLELFGALYFIPPSVRRRRIEELIDRLRMGEYIDRTVETYSSGQRMKLAFAKALINDAPILVLDEPTNTLDVPSARELRDVVRELNREGRTILYTTHQMAEAETLCHRVAIIDRGRVIALGTVPELKASLRQDGVIRVEGVIPSAAVEAVRQVPGVVQAAVAEEDGVRRLTIVCPEPRQTLPSILQTLLQRNAVIQHLAPEEVTLEDVFIAKTGRTLAEDTRVV